MANLFSKPKMPKVEPPTPLPDEKQLTAARKRVVASEVASGGRQSTYLTSAGRETLGA
jgi:hypothetical protein